MSSLVTIASSVYRTSPHQKRLSQNAAKVYKYGSPKIRDAVREKCRIRVKEARSATFNECRIGVGKTLIDKILREELSELEDDIVLQEQIFNELIDEANLWFAEDYENSFYDQSTRDNTFAFCPVCQKSELTTENKLFYCKCGARFNYNGTRIELRDKIYETMEKHDESGCSDFCAFFVEPVADGRLLNIHCISCDFFATLR